MIFDQAGFDRNRYGKLAELVNRFKYIGDNSWLIQTYRQRWQAPGVPAELAKRVIRSCIRETCFFGNFMGLKSKKFSSSLLTRHLYTRQLACEPQTGGLDNLSVAVRNERKMTSSPIESLHLETCRPLLLLCLYARTKHAENSC